MKLEVVRLYFSNIKYYYHYNIYYNIVVTTQVGIIYSYIYTYIRINNRLIDLPMKCWLRNNLMSNANAEYTFYS